MTKVEYEFRKKYHEVMKLPFDFDLTKDQEIVDMFVHFANGWCSNKDYTEKLIKENEELKQELYEWRKYEQ